MGEATEEIKDMVQQLQVSIAGGETPLSPKVLRREDFRTRYWNVASWREKRNNGKIKDSDINAPIFSIFMEDEFGVLVSDEVKDEVLDTLQSYWIDVHDSGELICNWKETGFRRKEDFLATMERKFPWLRLCEGHWKTKQLWINYFGRWKRSPSNKQSPVPGDSRDTKKKDSPPHERQETPIDISSDVSNGLASLKHGRDGDEDCEPAPSKRHKGKEREAAPSTFHPPRPQPKKTKAKLGKVRLSLTYPVARPPLSSI